MKNALFRTSAALSRAYLQHFPLRHGKKELWNRAVRPYVAWRDMTFQCETSFGVRLNLCTTDIIQRYIYFFGIWEPVITEYLRRCLKPGDTFIDIGANIGYHSLLAARLVGPGGRVFAIEASPSIFALLERHIDLNGATNITAVKAAVYRERAEVPIYLHAGENLGGTTIVTQVAARRHAAVEAMVQAMPLSEIIAPGNIVQARVIKIDVEGAEWPVVQGFAELLPDLSETTEILVEVDAQALRDQGTTPEDFVRLFTASGFRPFIFDQRLGAYDHRIEAYLGTFSAEMRPLADLTFDGAEILFRR